MKIVLTLLAIAITSSVNAASAQDNNTDTSKEVTHAYPLDGRGGWDGNNAKISVVRAKLLRSSSCDRYPLDGGWGSNNARLSIIKTKLVD